MKTTPISHRFKLLATIRKNTRTFTNRESGRNICYSTKRLFTFAVSWKLSRADNICPKCLFHSNIISICKLAEKHRSPGKLTTGDYVYTIMVKDCHFCFMIYLVGFLFLHDTFFFFKLTIAINVKCSCHAKSWCYVCVKCIYTMVWRGCCQNSNLMDCDASSVQT